ncbi:hypothetical protein EU545_01590 [Candidatus Thorarchaeota archaeon]|nr:MAG: hypothetical protein EU545_01590 [Candidatus Thorarchaeota archaeon]
MKLVRVEIRNFKPFKQLVLPDNGDELPEGLILVKGPNSTGKSSLFEAILWGMWGSDAISLTNDEVVSFTSTHCTVIIEFRVAGSEFKIHREYNSADGPSVVLFSRKGKAWKRIADKTQSVRTKIDEILSLDHKQALQTLLVRQGEVSVIANATPVILRRLLEGIYDIGLLKQMESHLENMEKDIDMKKEALERDYEKPESIRRQIEDYEGRIRHEEGRISELNSEIESTEKMLQSMPDISTLKDIGEAESLVKNANRDLEKAKAALEKDLGKAGFVDVDASLIETRMESLKKVQERAESERTGMSERVNRISQEVGSYQGINRDLSEKIDHLKGVHTGTDEEMLCPTCSKPLTANERDRLVGEYEATIKENKDRIKNLKAERKSLGEDLEITEKKIKQALSSEQAAMRVRESYSRTEEAKEEHDEATKSLQEALSKADVDDLQSLMEQCSVKSISELETKLALLNSTLANLKGDLSKAKADLKREQELLLNLEGKEDLMKKIKMDIDELQRLDAHTKYVRRKLVSGFVADYIFQKRLIGIIKSATNQYVRFFTNDQYTSVDLEPTGARGRSGSGLLLRIWDERDKAWKKASQLSYGDRTAVSLGLRLGISRTMSSIRPLKDSPAKMPMVRCVFLDEPLGGLDRTRREAVVTNLTNDQSFEQIFLITHTDIGGWEGVPTIEVSKEGSSSAATLFT